jgi:hypothetical protein
MIHKSAKNFSTSTLYHLINSHESWKCICSTISKTQNALQAAPGDSQEVAACHYSFPKKLPNQFLLISALLNSPRGHFGARDLKGASEVCVCSEHFPFCWWCSLSSMPCCAFFKYILLLYVCIHGMVWWWCETCIIYEAARFCDSFSPALVLFNIKQRNKSCRWML